MPQTLIEQLRADHQRNYGWALACCGWQPELAEDVLQEAYIRVLDGRAVFSGHATARTWFFAVIRRIAGELRRTNERRSILNLKLVAGESDGEEHAGELSPAEQHVARSESAAGLRAALLQLSQRQREVLHLVFYSELSIEQAAETLAISLGSARTHYHRGKLQLAELLNREPNDES